MSELKFNPGDKVRHKVSNRDYLVDQAHPDFFTVVGFAGTFPYSDFTLIEIAPVKSGRLEVEVDLSAVDSALTDLRNAVTALESALENIQIKAA